MFKVVCAWCGKHLSGIETADEVSHGICEACQATAVSDFPAPVHQRESDDVGQPVTSKN